MWMCLRSLKAVPVALWLVSLLATSGIGETPIQPDSGSKPVAPAIQRKQLRAYQINGETVRLDGNLDDAVWRNATFADGFLQKEPNQGESPTDPMEVAVLYDDEAIYVAAKMYSKNPDALRMHLDRRDSQGPAEQFILMLDTYLDRRTAYVFGVNTAGVRFDRFHSQDTEYNRDYSYNPVWEARTSRDSESWMCEIRIPFSQLRFTDKENQIWGVNFNRWIPAQNEDVFWVYTPRQETGYASRFGNLVGMNGVKPSKRIELLPYAASDNRFTGNVDENDPFNDGTTNSGRIGGDLRMGLGPNLTLEATVNPDFGQVEADAAEVNLSAFETFFPEKRPFFNEGSQLFDAEGGTYFYSRRVGGRPHGGVDGDFTDVPNNTSILGATKLTGRLQSGLSIGALAAVTQREYGDGYYLNDGSRVRSEIEPLTFYGITRLQQEFGEHGSTAGIILTGVKRDMDNGDPLRSVLRSSAVAGEADWKLRFEGGKYDLIGHVGFSNVRGDADVMRATQESSAHYFQRPDATEVELDTTLTSMTGYTLGMRGGKRSGKHWLWGGGFSMESPKFELNDAGILRGANDRGIWNHIQYRETEPGTVFRNYNLNLSHFQEWNYAGVHQSNNIDLNINYQLKNFWSGWVGMSRQGRSTSDSRTRGGPLVGFEEGLAWWAGISNPWSKTTQYGFNGTYAIDELGGWVKSLRANFSTRFGTKMQLSANPSWRKEDQPRQYVTELSGTDSLYLAGTKTEFDYSAGGSSTYDKRYVFSRINQSVLSMQMRVNYFFTPDLSLEVYAEPFVANGRFYGHGQVPFAGTIDLSTTGDDGSQIIDNPNGNGTFIIVDANGNTLSDVDPNDTTQTVAREHGSSNFNYLSFRSNFVLRWEFSPGSALYAVWQRNLQGDNGRPGQNVRGRDLWDTLKGEGEDFFALKLSYWIPLSG